MKEYNHIEVEKKWKKYWEEHKSFKALNNTDKKHYYIF